MEPKKLYTLAQFVDYIHGRLDYDFEESYYFIIEYHRFLKQTLTKEMFINTETYSPKAWAEGIASDEKWQGGEKKIIFNKYLTNAYCQRINVTTLHDLAEHTKGNLELKNVVL